MSNFYELLGAIKSVGFCAQRLRHNKIFLRDGKEKSRQRGIDNINQHGKI
jgi:hypothetical protein